MIEMYSDFTLAVACDIASFIFSDPRTMDRMKAPLNFDPSDHGIYVEDNIGEVMSQYAISDFQVETVSGFMSATMPRLTMRKYFNFQSETSYVV